MTKRLRLTRNESIANELGHEYGLYFSLIDLLLEQGGLNYNQYYTITDEKPKEPHITLVFHENESNDDLIKVSIEEDLEEEFGNMCKDGFFEVFGIFPPEKLYVIL
jgi:hypothetical protein